MTLSIIIQHQNLHIRNSNDFGVKYMQTRIKIPRNIFIQNFTLCKNKHIHTKHYIDATNSYIVHMQFLH